MMLVSMPFSLTLNTLYQIVYVFYVFNVFQSGIKTKKGVSP
jgi:hypothetical protein